MGRAPLTAPATPEGLALEVLARLILGEEPPADVGADEIVEKYLREASLEDWTKLLADALSMLEDEIARLEEWLL